MIELVRPVLATILLAMGVFFYISGAVGLLRFPDVYNRLHASTKAGSIGSACILLAGIVALDIGPVTVKSIAILFFLTLTFPVTGHLLAHAAYATGVPVTDRTLHDEYRYVITIVEHEAARLEPEE